MIQNQKYIIVIIFLLAPVFFFTKKSNLEDLPNAIGEPLELVVVQNRVEFDQQFYDSLKEFLTLDIGPSPQEEAMLNIMEIENDNFKGILKRHQNLLFISKSDSFNIQWGKDVFAQNQIVIFINCASHDDLQKNQKQIKKLVNRLREIEISRQIFKYSNQVNLELKEAVSEKHNISMLLPKNFFLAHSDSQTTWIRHEAPKISKGILISNLSPGTEQLIPSKSWEIGDSIIKKYILGPLENSYMRLEKEAPISLDTIMINNLGALKIQSLWRMENDFMGGVFNIYSFPFNEHSPPIIIYTYVYAPGENKKIPLMHLEAIIKTTSYLE